MSVFRVADTAADDARGRARFRAARSPFSWLLEREVVRYLRIWPYSVLGQMVTPLMMLSEG